MSVGSIVRRLFGPYEHQISAAYRAIYLDLDALIKRFRLWKPEALRILEIGCGEGAVTERLRVAYPDAEITAIDITPRVGRLYRGSLERVRFIQCSIQDLVASGPAPYDLVMLCDVIHHVPVELRQGILDSIAATIAPQGLFVFKDWEKNNSPIHALCYLSDRWLTGDRIHYLSREEFRQRLAHSFGEAAIVDEARVGPWWNNIAFLISPGARSS
jgi:2-polyprenyl-6-hydroxyphenyl methylase/3-demethylubiquinone-9 3-methyltransferase